ncbi:Ribonuclease 2, partial [Lathyrus oleraceus]
IHPIASRNWELTIMSSPLSRLLCLFLALAVFAGESSPVTADELERGGGGGHQQREFDYFALALQWPGTFCKRTRYCCSSNACCRGSNSPAIFTIHGLWPDYNDGTWPACCTKSRFDPKEISTLDTALEQYWPSLSCGSPSSCSGGKGSFWAHEVLTENYLFSYVFLNYYQI